MAAVSARGQMLTHNAAWKPTRTRAPSKGASQSPRRDTECLNAASIGFWGFSVGQKHKLTSWDVIVHSSAR